MDSLKLCWELSPQAALIWRMIRENVGGRIDPFSLLSLKKGSGRRGELQGAVQELRARHLVEWTNSNELTFSPLGKWIDLHCSNWRSEGTTDEDGEERMLVSADLHFAGEESTFRLNLFIDLLFQLDKHGFISLEMAASRGSYVASSSDRFDRPWLDSDRMYRYAYDLFLECSRADIWELKLFEGSGLCAEPTQAGCSLIEAMLRAFDQE